MCINFQIFSLTVHVINSFENLFSKQVIIIPGKIIRYKDGKYEK